MIVAELLPGPVLFELADPDADEAESGLGIGAMIAAGYSLDGLSLLVRTRELLLFNTSNTRSFSSFSSAFFRLCAILPACRLCWIKTFGFVGVPPDECE